MDSARTVTAAAETAGLAMLDAPVSGGAGRRAQNGTLTFMVGGMEEAFARGKSVLEAMGKNIFHAGGPGAGQAVKICNNMMLAINMVGVSEGFLLAEKLGLDWGKLHQICATATANSWALSNYCPAPGPVPAAPSNRDYAPGFATALMVKDVKLSQAAAEATGSPTPLAAKALSLQPAGRQWRRRRQGFLRGIPLAGRTKTIIETVDLSASPIRADQCVSARRASDIIFTRSFPLKGLAHTFQASRPGGIASSP